MAKTTTVFISSLILALFAVVCMTIKPSSAIGIFVFVVLPFLLAYVQTKNILLAIVFIWLFEQLIGMSGSWISIGPIPGRGLILLLLIASIIYNPNILRYFEKFTPQAKFICFFYGAILPILLLFNGVVFREASLSDALGDVLRLFGFLGVFPVAYAVSKHANIVKAWILGLVFALTVIFVFASLVPNELKMQIVDNWVYLGNVGGRKINYIRLSYEPLIYCFVIYFHFLLLILNNKRPIIYSFLIFLSLLPVLINFLRGPLVACFAVTLLVVICNLFRSTKRKQIFKITLLVSFVISCSISILMLNPIAADKMDSVLNAEAFEDYVGDVRVEQSRLMISAWIEHPFFGQGVGIPLEGYYRGSGLSIEVQHLMIFYRTGIFGYVALMSPFLFLFVEIIKNIGNSHPRENLRAFERTVSLTLTTMMIAAMFNPYLASSITITLFILYFSFKRKNDQIERAYSRLQKYGVYQKGGKLRFRADGRRRLNSRQIV